MASFYPGFPPVGSYAAPAGYPTWAPHHLPPVHNPSLPYLSNIIKGGLKPGMLIHVHGNVPHNADRFFINLQVGSSTQPRADVALHFNPRMHANQTVLNTLMNQHWVAEVHGPAGCFPFRHGKRFEIIILVERHCYKIAVNGMHYMEYKHHIPVHGVNTIHIGGSAHVSYICIDKNGGTSDNFIEPVRRPKIPYFMDIPGGMKPGRMVIFNGFVTPNADKFIVNIQQGHAESPHNVAMHFNPRFAANSVVMNAKHNNHWGGEMVGPSFPFYRNRPFEMIILCERDKFRVAINGEHFIDFNHRMPLHHANHVAVFGNVRVNHIRLM